MTVSVLYQPATSFLIACKWMLVVLSLLYCKISLAQADVNTESPPPAPVAPSISVFEFQSQIFAQDIQRQMTDFIAPVTIGDYVLNTLHYQTVAPTVKAYVLFITAGFGNSAQMQMYQALSQVFVDAGYNTMIATLPVGDTLPKKLADAGDYWAESLNGIINAVENSSPYSVVYAGGPIAATLLSLYDAQRLPLPDALVMQNVFFPEHDDNRKLPALMARFPNALLDLSQARTNRWADATLKTRQQTIQVQSIRNKTHRKLIGTAISEKQRYVIYKEMSGWFKRIGWM